MKRILICLAIALCACDTEEEALLFAEKPTIQGDYIVFGWYYGFCEGEQCIEIFKLTGDALYEDSNDNYPDSQQPYKGDYEKLSQEKFEAANSLADYIPPTLFKINDTIIGQPDFSDGGGVYFEYNVGSIHRYWLIDQFTHIIPEELQPLVTKVNEVVTILQ